MKRVQMQAENRTLREFIERKIEESERESRRFFELLWNEDHQTESERRLYLLRFNSESERSRTLREVLREMR